MSVDNSFYTEGEKMTYGMAEILVRRHLKEKDGWTSSISAKYICDHYGYPDTKHNVCRVVEALDKFCVRADEFNGRRKRFNVPEDGIDSDGAQSVSGGVED